MTRLTRVLSASAVAGVLMCSGAGAALAADGAAPTPVSAADRAAATNAASQGRGLDLARRVAQRQIENGGPKVRSFGTAPQSSARGKDTATTTATAEVVDGTTTQVNVLSKDFVTRGHGPVGHLGYVANSVRVGDQVVTVMSAKVDGGWKAVNAAGGDEEARYAAKARGGQLLNEPQINAWYSVTGNRVLPLNDEARAVVGQGVSLAAYQGIVHAKYADKMPGSAYDTQGLAGGFGQPAAPAADTAAAPATASTEQSGPSTALLAGVGGVGAAALAGVLLTRRRRSEA